MASPTLAPALLPGQQVFGVTQVSTAGPANYGAAPQLATIAVTSAQLLAIKDTAITLIVAPGAGFQIVPISLLINMNNGTVQYTDAGGAVSITQGTWTQALAANTIFLGAVSTRNHQSISFAALATAATTPTNENAALTLTKITNNFAAGNGTATVYVLYHVLPVT